MARREAGRPLATTAELAALVAGAIPVRNRRDAAQHPATRTFQAVRIHINQELEELALVLAQSVSLLTAGGRLVVISFHSLEDRLVKRFIEGHARPERGYGRLPLRAAELPQPRLRSLARVKPDAAEVAANPRARSAVMRVADADLGAVVWRACAMSRRPVNAAAAIVPLALLLVLAAWRWFPPSTACVACSWSWAGCRGRRRNSMPKATGCASN